MVHGSNILCLGSLIEEVPHKFTSEKVIASKTCTVSNYQESVSFVALFKHCVVHLALILSVCKGSVSVYC